MNRVYSMSRTEYQGLLKIACKQVPSGVYAVEKNGYAELRCDHCDSITKLKKLTKQFRQQGFKVHKNGG